MRIRKAFISFLTLLLVLIPFGVFAQPVKNQISYVSLGDSLAAGMLYDRSPSKGYVGVITNELKYLGYTVTEKNLGVPGFTTSDVLEVVRESDELPEHADLVTISAGANDLLSGLDIEKITSYDPNKIIQAWEEFLSRNVKTFNDFNDNMVQFNFILGEVNSQLEPIFNELEQIKDNEIEQAINHYDQNFDNVDAKQEEIDTVSREALNALAELDLESMPNINQHLKEVNTYIENMMDAITILKNHPLLDEDEQIIEDIMGKFTDAQTILQDNSEMITSLVSLAKELKKLLQEADEFDAILRDLEAKINKVGNNMIQIIQEVKQRYPEAKVYVMGYYNALPYLSENTQGFTVPLIQGLNNAIKIAANHTGVTYISTFERFEGNYETYLPNPADIHPSEAGYRALADAYLDEIVKSFPEVEIPEEVEVNLGETIQVYPGQNITIKGTNVQILIPATIEPGTMLTVTSTDEEVLTKVKNLKAVGAVLHFNFEYPVYATSLEMKNENVDHLFTLTFGYEHDSDEVAIYHFNEAADQWEKVGGQVNKETKEVSVQVEHFSNYGVFAEVTEQPPEKDEEGSDDEMVEEDEETKVVIQDGEKPNESKETSRLLPKTATNLFNIMIVGSVLIGIGIAIYVIAHRRKQLN